MAPGVFFHLQVHVGVSFLLNSRGWGWGLLTENDAHCQPLVEHMVTVAFKSPGGGTALVPASPLCPASGNRCPTMAYGCHF